MLQISDNAARLIKKMTDRNGVPDGGLRIGIKAGGCSGLSYTFAWEAAPRETDHVFDGPEGAKVFVDPKSYGFIKGTTLDYDTSLVSKGFIFNNPNAKSIVRVRNVVQRVSGPASRSSGTSSAPGCDY